jgi:degT/dnrJ/eryC1/strS aminotransferase
MIPVYKPDLTGNEKKYLNDCVDTTWISSKGFFIDKFENKFCEFTSAQYASTVSNGTVAIHLALKALGIGNGDEVIVPTLTYIASVNPIVEVGAKPVFADSLEDTWQINPQEVRKKITKRTKALIVTHLYGQAAEMDSLMQIAKEFNLFVIEDCAEAFGTFYKNQHVGTFGDIGTFSFFGNKTITCGEGGMVTAKDDSIFKKMLHLKNQGVSDTKQYWHDAVAYNYRMTNMQAAIGLAQIERVDYFINRKREVYNLYKKCLNLDLVDIHQEQQNTIHSFWMVSILVKNKMYRDSLRKYLAEKGIETRPLFYPIHTMPMFDNKENFAVAEDLSSKGINLPSWPGLQNQDIEEICFHINNFLQRECKC